MVVLAGSAGRIANAQGGAATGDARTYTSIRTAGVVDPAAPVVFEDVTSKTTLKDFLEVGGRGHDVVGNEVRQVTGNRKNQIVMFGRHLLDV